MRILLRVLRWLRLVCLGVLGRLRILVRLGILSRLGVTLLWSRVVLGQRSGLLLNGRSRVSRGLLLDFADLR